VFARQLDADHRRIFEQLEKVRQAVDDEDGQANELGLRVWRLSKDLSIHLASEERLMRQWGYPALEWHESQHQAGRHKMGRLLVALRDGRGDGQASAFEDLVKCKRDHIHLADRMFAAHLRNGQRERLAS